MNQSAPLVPRNVYIQAVLKELNAVPYDPLHHNGMHNPYSQKYITCSKDYEEYVREYVYYRLCDEILRRQYEAQLDHQVNELTKQSETRLALQSRQLEKRHQDEIDQLNARHHETVIRLNSQHDKELSRARWRWPMMVVTLVIALLCTFFLYTPNQIAAGHEAGFKEGKDYADQSTYESGYSAGYMQAFADGIRSSIGESQSSGETQSSSNSSSSYSGSSSNSNTTPGYITEPLSWVGLDRTVYVSQRSHTIHLNSGCSGMRNYFSMSYGDACTAGYAHCRTCF